MTMGLNKWWDSLRSAHPAFPQRKLADQSNAALNRLDQGDAAGPG